MNDLDIHHVAAILYGGEYERRHAELDDHDDADSERYNRQMLCRDCHRDLTVRVYGIGAELMRLLTDAEYAYMIERGGEHYPERAYGMRYGR